MEKNEIKKALYKEKPIANRLPKTDEFVWYSAKLKLREVKFKIPHEEALNFGQNEYGQFLIRWLQN